MPVSPRRKLRSADPSPLRLAGTNDPWPEPQDLAVKPSSTLATSIEPSLTFAEVCRIRAISRRTGERERAAGLWPKPDYYVGTGTRKSPRWRPGSIRRWLEGGRP